MICPYCGTENRALAKFCDYCGAELPTVAPEAHEMFDDDSFLVEGEDAITLDLQGLERMVDSSNSGVMFDDGISAGSNADIYDGYTDTISLDQSTSVLDQAFRASNGDAYGRADVQGDIYTTQTIPLQSASAYETAQFPSVATAPIKDGSKAVSDIGAYSSQAKTFSVDGKEAKPSKSASVRKRLIAGVIAGIALIALIAAGFITYSLQLWGGISVPDVVRQTEDAAVQNLEAAGFSVDVEYVVSDDVQGIVVSTNPSAGTRIDQGSLVVISVSIARIVPDIVGLSQEEAVSALSEAGYADVEFVTQKSNEAEGSVLAVDPPAGTEATSDAHITVTVAEPFRVPSVEGMTRDEAIAALEAEGYTVKTVSYITEDIQEGMAVSTDPAAGTVLASGSEVVLNVAHNRSTELIDATRAFFSSSKQFSINGMSYELTSIDGVSYKGSDTCAFTITARPFETHTWLFGETETRYGNNESISGTIVFNADNSIKSTDPAIKRIG